MDKGKEKRKENRRKKSVKNDDSVSRLTQSNKVVSCLNAPLLFSLQLRCRRGGKKDKLMEGKRESVEEKQTGRVVDGRNEGEVEEG